MSLRKVSTLLEYYETVRSHIAIYTGFMRPVYYGNRHAIELSFEK